MYSLLSTPRLSGMDEDARRTAIQAAIMKQDGLNNEIVDDLINKFRKSTTVFNGHVGITAPQMMEIADKFNPAVKTMIRAVIKRRYDFPKYSETPGLYDIDQLASVLQWYERKVQHRTYLLTHAGDLEVISAYQLQSYVSTAIIPDFYKTSFNLICTEAALLCCPSSRPNLISIKSLLASTILDEIDESIVISGTEYDQEPIKWFSVQNMFSILHHFRIMDEGNKGMLTYSDFFKLGNLNSVFINGFWNSPKCYKFPRESSGENSDIVETIMETDLSGLVCFERALFYITSFSNNDDDSYVCPMEYDAVLCFVFRCLSENYETSWTIKHFNHILECLRIALTELDQALGDQTSTQDLVNIFINYLSPSDPETIYFSDVLALDKNLRPGSKSAASLFLGMLVDARKFRAYDCREGI